MTGKRSIHVIDDFADSERILTDELGNKGVTQDIRDLLKRFFIIALQGIDRSNAGIVLVRPNTG